MNALTPTQIEDKLLSTPEEQTLNETQRVLMKALELLGPNGEHWHCGGTTPSGRPWDTTGMCSGWAIARAEHKGGPLNWPDRSSSVAFRYLDDAALEQMSFAAGGDVVSYWNDVEAKTFENVRTAFHRAIALAGEQ